MVWCVVCVCVCVVCVCGVCVCGVCVWCVCMWCVVRCGIVCMCMCMCMCVCVIVCVIVCVSLYHFDPAGPGGSVSCLIAEVIWGSEGGGIHKQISLGIHNSLALECLVN